MLPIDLEVADLLVSIIKEAYALYEMYRDREKETAAFATCAPVLAF